MKARIGASARIAVRQGVSDVAAVSVHLGAE